MNNEPLLDQMETRGLGGNHHVGRHTGKYHNMSIQQLLSDPQLQKLRECSDAVEAVCQRIDGTKK